MNDFERLFELDQTGHLYISLKRAGIEKKNLDLSDVYELTLMARDRGTPTPRESSLTLKVRIDPNYFSFNQASENDKLELKEIDIVHLKENTPTGTEVAIVQVLNSFQSIIDDSSSSSSSSSRSVNLTFELLSLDDTFKINARTGRIEVLDSSKLDYERVREFVVVVRAQEVQKMATFKRTRTGQTK